MVRRLLNLLTAREWTVVGLFSCTCLVLGWIGVAVAIVLFPILVKLLIELIERATKYLDGATAAIRAKQRSLQSTESDVSNE